MRRLLLVIIISAVALAIAGNYIAHHPVRRPAPAAFLARSYADGHGHVLRYRLLLPAGYDARRRYPLVLFLHGSSERGDDNKSQLRYLEPFTAADARQRYPCVLVVPQCPKGEHWVHARYARGRFIPSRQPCTPMRLTLALLDQLQCEYPIDRHRIYVGGLSMGGSGTWDIIMRRPRLFAAAFPMCGRGDTAQASTIARMPIWVFHGADDHAVGVSWSRDMVAALRRAGGHPRYTEMPGVKHNCWTRAMNRPDFLPWLFAQRR